MTITVQPVPVDVRPFNSVTVRYDAVEDRILLALNAGTPQACGFWLTRRLVLSLIERAHPFIDKSSSRVGQTPAAYRGELAVMERQVAIASMAKNMTKTPNLVLAQTLRLADLATEVTITIVGEGFRIAVLGRNGAAAAGICTRAELQSIMHIVELEVGKTGWNALVAPPASQPDAAVPETKQRAN